MNVAVCFLWYVSVCVESVWSKNVHGDPMMLGSRPSLFGDKMFFTSVNLTILFFFGEIFTECLMSQKKLP